MTCIALDNKNELTQHPSIERYMPCTTIKDSHMHLWACVFMILASGGITCSFACLVIASQTGVQLKDIDDN